MSASPELVIFKSRTALRVDARTRQATDLVRSVPGYEWNKGAGCWQYPLDYSTFVELANAIKDVIDWPDIDTSADVTAWYVEEAKRHAALSELRAHTDAELLYEHAARLYPYQRVMVRFLAQAGRALCDDQMGLGKTPEMIGAVREMELMDYPLQGMYLVICPNSLRGNWRREILTWYGPDANVVVVRSGKELRDPEPGWFILNWEKTHRRPELFKVPWDVIIADEAHRMKGRDTKQSKATRKLKAPYVFALTGTPIKNDVTDLWPVLNWLHPERYASFWRFFEMYVDYRDGFYGREVIGTKNEDRLKRSLHTIRFGRKVEEIDEQLPPVTIKQIPVDLEETQRKAYDRMRDEFVAWLDGSEGEVVAQNWMTQALRLKQLAGSTALLDAVDPKSAKLDALMELMDESPPEEKWVVMTQFRSMVTLLGDRLREQKVGFCEMMGGGHNKAYLPSVGYRDAPERDELIQWFQNSEKPRVFIATVQTGGEGITLTSSRYFAFLDLLWTPTDNEQAWKRIHRRGQDRACFVYEFLARNTIDYSAIIPTLRRKQDIIDRLRSPLNPDEVAPRTGTSTV